MAETTEFVSTIRVRDLISAFESKSESVKVEFTRPRAKSVGNILAKNVIVRQNDFNNLDDVENALKKLDTNLNFYEVYNKTKHVTFQEQLFNILTSIVNIEDHDEDATARKKTLIAKTQTLVSFLNQKLPSNANPTAPTNQYKYVSYATRVKENGNAEEKSSIKIQAPYSETTKSIDITDSGEEFFVSVKKLKETFQANRETKVEEAPKIEKSFKSDKVLNIQRINGDNLEQAEVGEKKVGADQVSVSKLRNLFEQKSEENSKGLGIIADDKTQSNKLIFRSASMNVHIPYTERNLGNVRLQRSVSGHYMNYVGLLKRVDISKSTGDLNKANTDIAEVVNTIRDSSDEDSGAESDETLEDEEEQKKVSEIVRYFDSSADNPHSKTETTSHVIEKGSISNTEAAEDIKERYSAIEKEKKHDNDDTTSTKGFQELESNYFATTDDIKQETAKDQEEKAEPIEDVEEEQVNFSTPETKNIPENESVATVGAEEVNVKYSTATSNDIEEETDQDREQTATIDGVEEEEIHFATAEAKNLLENETVATTTGVDEVNVNYSTVSSDDIKQNREDIAEVQGVEDTPVTSSVTSSTVSQNTVQGVEEVPVTATVTSSTISETTTSDSIQNHSDATDNVSSCPTIGSDDFNRKREEEIEEELEKIDVEPTLADEIIELNAEDLKNAENEFEKLLKSSET